jgi:polyisoprenoid-binding protein YceI
MFSFSALPAHAAPEVHGVRLSREGLVVVVPYTLGTHHEHVTGVEGTLRLDPATFRLEGGRLAVPLTAFHGDDAKRGCHLREALGLDYARSRFPGEHVCDGQNRLPASGPDAIVFPEIILQLARGEPAAGAPTGAATEIEVEGTLTVHGVTRPVRFNLAAERELSVPGALRVRGRVPLRLSDFGVQVKPAKVVLVTIAVKDEVTVVIDTLLEPVIRR